MSRPTAVQKRYWDTVVRLGCSASFTGIDVTIHHAHGGSLAERGFGRSFGRKTSHWLVLPIARKLHVGVGGIDGPYRITVEEWEAKHGRQADMIDRLVKRTGIDVWALARAEEKGMVPRRAA